MGCTRRPQRKRSADAWQDERSASNAQALLAVMAKELFDTTSMLKQSTVELMKVNPTPPVLCFCISHCAQVNHACSHVTLNGETGEGSVSVVESSRAAS
jgi:hypothetical protein